MHAGKPPEQKKDEVKDSSSENNQSQGGENKGKNSPPSHGDETTATAKCTELCGDKYGGRSCSKICLASVYLKNPEEKIRTYVVIDDQSNCSLAKPIAPLPNQNCSNC